MRRNRSNSLERQDGNFDKSQETGRSHRDDGEKASEQIEQEMEDESRFTKKQQGIQTGALPVKTSI